MAILLKLDISYNSIRRDGANAIADALKHCTYLEELSISDNFIGDGGARVLARSICQCLLKFDINLYNVKAIVDQSLAVLFPL